MTDIGVKIGNLLAWLIGCIVKMLNKDYVYITTEDFTGSGGKPTVRVAHITPNTKAVYVSSVGQLAELEPDKYLPAMTPSGKVTSQGYYSLKSGAFVSAYQPIHGDGTKAGDYNIDW